MNYFEDTYNTESPINSLGNNDDGKRPANSGLGPHLLGVLFRMYDCLTRHCQDVTQSGKNRTILICCTCQDVTFFLF